MGKNCAIAIGINQYYNLRPLKYAHRDAESVKTFCQSELGFELVYFFAAGVPLIQTPQGPPLQSNPTVGNLERFLSVRFEEKFLEAGDNLWFFFAGHGKRYNGRDYLMPMDGDPKNVEKTAISIRSISDRLRRSGADNVILMVDACRVDDDRDGGEGIGREKQQGVVTFLSCSPNELSYEVDELQHGTFTYTLIEGLSLQDEGNCATVERLNQYLCYNVPRINNRYCKPEQTPYAIVEPAAKYHLILLPRAATTTDRDTLKAEAFKAEAQGDYELAKQLWVRVLAVSPADSDAIEAIERLAIVIRSPIGPKWVKTRRKALQILLGGSAFGGMWTLSRIVPQGSPSSTTKPAGNLQLVEFKVVSVNSKGQIVGSQKDTTSLLNEDLGNGGWLEMVKIPSGSFQMGSTSSEEGRQVTESPQHKVTVSSFWMGRYEVTQSQWKAVAWLPKVKIHLDPDPSKFKGANRPVEQVSWYDAVEFCTRLSKKLGREFRLPSEAEWEYACRAGTATPFHFGETLTPKLANYDGNYTYRKGPKGLFRKQTTEVGSFKVANTYGLYDMHGNVWEWCQDNWHDRYTGNPPTDGTAWLAKNENDYYVARGGSWNDYPKFCRSASRPYNRPDYSAYDIGFRVVCSEESAW